MVRAKRNGLKTEKILNFTENMFQTSNTVSYEEPSPFRPYRKSRIIILLRFSNIFRINLFAF